MKIMFAITKPKRINLSALPSSEDFSLFSPSKHTPLGGVEGRLILLDG